MMGDLSTRVGAYRIVRLIGEGGMGSVYEARQEPLDRRVALKVLRREYARDEEALARLFNEAKALGRLQHPSIVQVVEFSHTPDGTAYLAMEYLRGENLSHRLHSFAERGERMPVLTSLQLAWQVADVLAVAHAQGIVHRDLKPDNLMLVADPVAPGGERVKILDFGLAKLSRSDTKSAVQTDTKAVIGTPMYMSPEQCAGAGGVDSQTDVYSLGCVLYEMLGGRPPFVAEGGGQLVGMHLFREPAPLSSLAPRLPPRVAELVHRLLTKDKLRRPSMSEACDDLGRILQKLPGGGSIVRSRLAAADADATRQLPILRALSTLGQSIGQLGTPARRRRILVAGVTGTLVVGLLLVLLLRGAQKTAPAVALPAAAPAATAVEPRREVKPESAPAPQPELAADEKPATAGKSVHRRKSSGSPAGSRKPARVNESIYAD